MQGLFVNGQRPKSKAALKRHLEAQSNPGDGVRIEATSVFGNEYDGRLVDMPDGSVTFVGPDPYRDRRFYGTLTKKGGKVTVK